MSTKLSDSLDRRNPYPNVLCPSAILALLLILLVGLAGCRTAQVTKAKAPVSANKTDKLDGIPFYIKKAACKHEVVWLEPIYTLTLDEITTPEGTNAKPQTTPRGAAVLSLSQYQEDPAVQKFLKALSQVGAQFEDVLKAWDDITKVPYTPTKFPEDAKNRVLVSNANTPDVYVDYAEIYYINAKNPVAGSAKVDTKLGSDGTLTEASVEIESKTLETLLGPINAAITAGLPLAAKAEVQVKAPLKQLKLTTEVSGFKHTFSRIDPSKSFPCPVISADSLPGPSNYSREGVATGSATDKKSKNKIQISGEVVLPDTAAKPTDDKSTTPK
jgi:hypothetical protein